MIQKLVTCPNPELLNNFLLGRLSSDEFESYEEHLASCDPCIETLQGMQVEEDTLDGLAQAAWRSNEVQSEDESGDSQIVNQLILQMQRMGDDSSNDSLGSVLDRSRQADEDRAAEVQRLLKPAKDSNSIGQLAHYRIIRLLGAGSTGIVYLAIDELLQREVALKILKPSLGNAARERFIAEARATALVDHPNVISIFAVGQEGNLAYIAMRWQTGQTLGQLLHDQETLSVEQTKTLGTQLSDGLAAAHQQGLIHRDIKPANVWIPSDNRPAVILDFGLVRISDEDPQLTCTGMIAGTPCYMSPEQSRGQALDGRSDLFSLGCLLYQSLTGKLPFHSGNALATLQSIQRDQPSAPFELDPSIPKDLSDLVLCLLEKSPKRRPETAEMVSIALNTNRKDWPFHILDSNAAPRQSRAKTKRVSHKLLTFIAILVVAFSGIIWSGFGTHITRIVTNQGEIVIDTLVDDVKIEVLRDGEHIQVVDLATDKSIVIKAGEYEIRQLGDRNSVQIQNGTLTLSRGEKEVVRITRTKAKMADDPTTDAFDEETDLADDLTAFDQFDQNLPLVLSVGQTRRIDLGSAFKGIQMQGRRNVRVQPASTTEVDVTGLRKGTVRVDFLLRDGKTHSQTFEVRQATNATAEGQDIDPVSIDRIPKFFRVQLGESKKIDLGFQCPEIQVEDPKLLHVTPVSPSEVDVKGLKLGSSRVHFKDVDGVVHSTMFRVHEAPYLLDSGDVLAILIDGVLGTFEDPKVHDLPGSDNTVPSIGFPVPVDDEGRINLPLIDPIAVRGKTVTEVKKEICNRYESGDDPILFRAMVVINLVRRRDFQRPLSNAMITKIANLKVELAESEQRLGANHPRIVSLKKQIESLENIDSPSSSVGASSEEGDSPSSRLSPESKALQSKVFLARRDAEKSFKENIAKSIGILQQAREEVRSSSIDRKTEEALLKILDQDLLKCWESEAQNGKVVPQPNGSSINSSAGGGAAGRNDEPPVSQEALAELTHLRALLRKARSDLAVNESPDWNEAIQNLSRIQLEISEAQFPSNEVRGLLEQVSEDIRSIREVSKGNELDPDRLSLLGRYAYFGGVSDDGDKSAIRVDSKLEIETPTVKRLRSKLGLLDSETEQADYHEVLKQLMQIRREQYASLSTQLRTAIQEEKPIESISGDREQCRYALSKIRLRLRQFEKANRLRPTEPVFQGRNYEEWRSLTLPNQRNMNSSAIEGLVYLSDEDMKQETFTTAIQVLTHNSNNSSSRTQGLRNFLRDEFLRKLSVSSAANLFVDELSRGSQNEIGFLFSYLVPELSNKYRNASEEVKKRDFVPLIEHVVECVCRMSEDESPTAVQTAYSYLSALFEAFPEAIVFNESTKQVVQRRFDEYFRFAPLSSGNVNLVFHLAPEIDGLSEKISTIFAEIDFATATRFPNEKEINCTLLCLERLSKEQQQKVFPSLIRFLKTKPKGTISSAWSTKIVNILVANPEACTDIADEIAGLQANYRADAERLIKSFELGGGGAGMSGGRRVSDEGSDMPDAVAKKLSDLLQAIQDEK